MGTIHTSHRGIVNVAVNYYQSLLGSEREVTDYPDDITLPSISAVQRVNMEADLLSMKFLKLLRGCM